MTVPGLVHGFGDARWSEADFLAFAASQGLRPVIMHQVHSDTVHRLDAAPAGKPEGDALMTNVPGLLLVIRTADCLPVLLVDRGEPGRGRRPLRLARHREAHPGEGRPGHGRGLRLEARGHAGRARPLHRGGLLRGRARGAGGLPEGRVSRRAVFVDGDAPGVHVPGLKTSTSSTSGPPTLGLLDGVGLQEEPNIFNAGPACTHCEPRLLSYRRNPADPRRMYNFIGLTLR
ncbi:MAG: laccase domain-containing protein [Candidatus Moduliflexus flocculans]|nr:laccase domain-containing protein [Candidatus Moduliflexus flocculans]